MSVQGATTEVARAIKKLKPKDFEELCANNLDLIDDLLRARFRYERGEFARYCWPERFTLPFNACHDSLLADEREHYSERDTNRSAIAAPRGLGKSTIASFVDPIHGIVYGIERLIVIMSATTALAHELTEDIKAAFEDTEETAFADLYGPFKVEGGKTDFTVTVRDGHSVRVVAKSFGQQVRGIKHRGERPTMFILDDSERSDRVRNPEQRNIVWRYLNDDILKAGRKQGGTDFRVRGTVLHPDSMLSVLLQAPGWRSERWKSIRAWPERSDLWDECGRIWRDLRLGEHRRQAALAFYNAHRVEMERGADVLDPAAEPLFALYELIWSEGLASFLREKNNEPRDAASAYFNSEAFARCSIKSDDSGGDIVIAKDGRRVHVRELTKMAYLDPIPGKELRSLSDDGGSGSSDYACIAILGRDAFGYTYVLDAWMKRCKDSDQLAALWSLCKRWGVKRATIEAIGFQRLMGRDFRRQRKARREDNEFWKLSVDEDKSLKGSKEDRIAALEPDITNDWLQFSQYVTHEVMGQFDDFPDASHDDGPDAIAGAYRSLGGSPKLMGQNRVV